MLTPQCLISQWMAPILSLGRHFFLLLYISQSLWLKFRIREVLVSNLYLLPFVIFLWVFPKILPDDGGKKHVWNVGQHLTDCTEQRPRQQASSFFFVEFGKLLLPDFFFRIDDHLASDSMLRDSKNHLYSCRNILASEEASGVDERTYMWQGKVDDETLHSRRRRCLLVFRLNVAPTRIYVNTVVLQALRVLFNVR
jgi:hypothetical protein